MAAALLFTGAPPPTQGAPLDSVEIASIDPAGVLPLCDPRPEEPTYQPLSRAARERAEEARGAVAALPPNSEIVRERQEAGRLLGLLGFELSGRARIHIEDVNGKHGGEVLRAAVATSSLAAGAEVTLNTTLPSAYLLAHVSPEDAARIQQNWRDIGRVPSGEVGTDRLAGIAVTWLEQSVYQVSARVQRMQDDLPSPWDGRRTLVNMSFVTNPYYVTRELAEKLMRSPEGTPGHREVERVLGHAPRVDRSCSPGRPNGDDVRVLMQKLLHPLVTEALQREDVVARLATARNHLEQTLRQARQVGIIVFKSAGNDHANAAERVNDAAFAADSVAGLVPLIEVCAIDLRGPGRDDDRIARFSSPGDVCAAGVDIPVVAGEVGRNTNGTSFASPIEVESAWTIDAVVPSLTAEQLIELLLHPHANTPVAETELEGAGRTDLFAVALLARHPGLDRATIDSIRASLLQDPSPENAAKQRALLSR